MNRARGAAVCLIAAALLVAKATVAGAHEGTHGDPELLNHWRAQVHVLFQSGHLVAFGLWLGGMAAATRVRSLSLESLLFASWAVFFVSVATGSYNMEFSAAVPTPPDILSLPGLLGRWAFGDAYIILIGVKQVLLVCSVLFTVGVTVRHLRRPAGADRTRLRRAFVAGSLLLGVTLAAITSMVLVLHEAVDLAPTPVHSLGGTVGPRDGDEMAGAHAATGAAPAPYGTETKAVATGFKLFGIPRIAMDAVARFAHLIGFALWLGAAAGSLTVPVAAAGRVAGLLWLGLGIQATSGAYQLMTWTPFTVTPLPWRLAEMTRFRFGYTYTVLLTLKLALAGAGTLATIALSVATRRAAGGTMRPSIIRALQGAHLTIGLLLAYVAMAMLLVHEGVDHAL